MYQMDHYNDPRPQCSMPNDSNSYALWRLHIDKNLPHKLCHYDCHCDRCSLRLR